MPAHANTDPELAPSVTLRESGTGTPIASAVSSGGVAQIPSVSIPESGQYEVVVSGTSAGWYGPFSGRTDATYPDEHTDYDSKWSKKIIVPALAGSELTIKKAKAKKTQPVKKWLVIEGPDGLTIDYEATFNKKKTSAKSVSAFLDKTGNYIITSKKGKIKVIELDVLPPSPQDSAISPGYSWGDPGTQLLGIDCFAIHNDGDGAALYAGGAFTQDQSGQVVENVAKWNGLSWSPLGSGPGTQVRAMASYHDGSSTMLYAAGNGGVKRWNGTAWHPVVDSAGEQVTGDVHSMVVFEQRLYAAGHNIYFASGVFSNIMRWDGLNWSSVGDGLDSWVHDLCVMDLAGESILIAAGRFAKTQGGQEIALNGVASWNGSSWASLGGGLDQFDDGTHERLAAQPGLLCLAGLFSTAGGVPSKNIACFDSSGWFNPVITADTVGSVEEMRFLRGPFSSDFLVQSGNFPAGKGIRLLDKGQWWTMPDAPLGMSAMIEFDGVLYFGGGSGGFFRLEASVEE